MEKLPSPSKYPTQRFWALVILVIILLVATGWSLNVASARSASAPVAQTSPIHPTFPFLDAQGNNVLASGKPVSTMETCGACHDTEFIAGHSFHADAGLSSFGAPGASTGGEPWDTSPGIFGKWDPLTYRYLTPQGETPLDLSTAEWLQTIGLRHVGGGPAVASRQGKALLDLPPNASDPEASRLDPATGQEIAWNWQESGVVEMNCFLCHTPNPANDARRQALQNGQFAWANMATLANSAIVSASGSTYQWNKDAFDEEGKLKAEYVAIQDPTNQNCGQCHGVVHTDLDEPLVMSGCESESWRTATTGQIISPQRLSDSGMNLQDKSNLSRTWDIHAERGLLCTDCHYSLNNPVYYQTSEEDRPSHLLFDPRRLEFGEYLRQPSHQFARGQSAQGSISPELKGTMRRCESCHSIEATHDWLPYKERHVTAMSCETCHAPKMYAPALQQVDWTVISSEGEPQLVCRGVGTTDQQNSLKSLVTGYQPVLLPRKNIDGPSNLAPYNLVSAFYWVYSDPPRPVRLADLRAAYLVDGRYAPEVLNVFDADRSGELDSAELRLDSEKKMKLIASRLEELGLDNPRVQAEVRPYSINHNITGGEWATRDCQSCHSRESKLAAPLQLTSYLPGGATLAFKSGADGLKPIGNLRQTENGEVFFTPSADLGGKYILGHHSVPWVDWLGAFMFLGVLLGVAGHGTLRFVSALRQPRHTSELKRVYMYGVYERLWHWLQTTAILLLIFTGLVIHRPDTFSIFSFRGVVLVHNALALILVINAFLSLFYHLASGEIRQFLPRPRGFFDQAIVQAQYYLKGIFKHDPHPFEKTPDKKLNPLQQATYFGLLNVLLPLQIITGALMWGAQRWPELAAALGGLPLLGPMHTLVAWALAAFVVAHVYLTTTGHTPLASIQAMINGWDEIEIARHLETDEQVVDLEQEVTQA